VLSQVPVRNLGAQFGISEPSSVISAQRQVSVFPDDETGDEGQSSADKELDLVIMFLHARLTKKVL
jgi:hypothetical protein